MTLVAGQALALEIPLSVEETKGIERISSAVNSGVPLPEGAVTDVATLRLLDANGEAVLASIEPRARWLGDKSLKWVTVHFLADLPPNGKLTYALATSDTPSPTSRIDVQEAEDAITVVTGPAMFVIPKDRFAPFDQVFVRSNVEEDFAEDDAILSQPSRVILVARNGESHVVPRIDEYEDEFRTEIGRIDETSFTQTAVIQTAAVEERGPVAPLWH
jgi:hypothetical protein